MKNKILIYGDSNLNGIDGSSVWITNLAELLARDSNNIVDILVKIPIQNNFLIQNLSKYSNIHILESGLYLKKNRVVNEFNIVKVLRKIDSLRDYSSIILRGKKVVQAVVETELKEKVIPYLTDFCHDEQKITQIEKDELSFIYKNVNHMFIQTEEMKDYLKRVLNIDGKKISILNPIVFSSPSEKKEPKTIVYAGKLAKKWYIEELLEIMDKLYQKDPEIKLYFIGNKFNSDLLDQKGEILWKLQNSPNIVYIEKLPKKETSELIKKCELGYGFRSSKVDNDESLEISVKFLEYCSFEVPSLLRETKMYKKILGNDYPLFIKNIDDAIEKILDFFDYKKNDIVLKLKKSFEYYNSENIYENIKSALYSYPMKKLRLLVSGHDLKFIKSLIPYFEKDYSVQIQELKEYNLFNQKEAKKIILGCDIIWCEWLLANAVWYSNHKYPHQTLVIRAHRFEITKNYGYQLNMEQVDKIITVSYFYYEEFISKFQIPRSKITVINNFVDTKQYTQNKIGKFQYNIAMIGAVPALKGLDKAVHLLIKLKQKDSRFKLYVAGKRPEQWPNSWNIEHERNYYLKIYDVIAKNNLKDDVIFTGWIDNKELLKKIGYVLSLSSLESFHLAPLEGMASNSIAFALPWPGIEYIYPENTIFGSLNEIANAIFDYSHNLEKLKLDGKKGHDFVLEHYDIALIYQKIKQVIE